MKEKIWFFIGLFFFISSIFFIGGCDTTNAEDDIGTYEYEQSLTYAQLQKEIETFEEWGDDVYCNIYYGVLTCDGISVTAGTSICLEMTGKDGILKMKYQ